MTDCVTPASAPTDPCLGELFLNGSPEIPARQLERSSVRVQAYADRRTELAADRTIFATERSERAGPVQCVSLCGRSLARFRGGAPPPRADVAHLPPLANRLHPEDR